MDIEGRTQEGVLIYTLFLIEFYAQYVRAPQIRIFALSISALRDCVFIYCLHRAIFIIITILRLGKIQTYFGINTIFI